MQSQVEALAIRTDYRIYSQEKASASRNLEKHRDDMLMNTF
jgi:hypothetical protein